MKRLLTLSLLCLATLAEARADCVRNCQTALKNFEKQCKEGAQTPDAKAGCATVLKKAEQQCMQSCATGQKPKKPANTNSF
ncbi:MAG: hypothetical protein GQE15_19465 [Archangiaceae bacterium]|nr:hypothetical protein [Archangiaceae bacterium]